MKRSSALTACTAFCTVSPLQAMRSWMLLVPGAAPLREAANARAASSWLPPRNAARAVARLPVPPAALSWVWGCGDRGDGNATGTTGGMLAAVAGATDGATGLGAAADGGAACVVGGVGRLTSRPFSGRLS